MKAYSELLMVCSSALIVVSQPKESWYKDEGGKNNYNEMTVMVSRLSRGDRIDARLRLVLDVVFCACTCVLSSAVWHQITPVAARMVPSFLSIALVLFLCVKRWLLVTFFFCTLGLHTIGFAYYTYLKTKTTAHSLFSSLG